MKWVILIWTFACIYWFGSGVNSAMSVVRTDASETAVGIAIIFGVFFWFGIWLVGALPCYMLAKTFNQRKAEVKEPEQVATHPDSRLCAYCGKYSPALGKFCSHCGTVVDAVKA